MRQPLSWDEVLLQITVILKQRSKDPRTQVACIAVSPDFRDIAWGYNGMISGFPEDDSLWTPENKYERVLHAEINMILNGRKDLTGWTVYTTIPPCSVCAKYLCQAGVARVVYKNDPKKSSLLDYEISKELFDKCNIVYEKYRRPNDGRTREVSGKISRLYKWIGKKVFKEK